MPARRSIRKATQSYERWLGSHLRLVRRDLRAKHRAMRDGALAFFRGSFFRWAERWREWCPELADGPGVVAVADLHIENFGTWRDAEGRLVWGVTDFDEAWPLPYTNDLVRLATSAILARREGLLGLEDDDVVGAVLEGYTDGLAISGQPFVLAEQHRTLRTMALARLRDAGAFWEKLGASLTLPERGLGSAARLLTRSLPRGATGLRFLHRQSGMGSLGRERVAVVAHYRGSKIAREVKALAPSACAWAEGRRGARRRWQRPLLANPHRSPDPLLRLYRRWILRRIAPDCGRIDLAGLPARRDERRLLVAMGWETANVHLASRSGRAILRDLARRETDWLLVGARRALGEVLRDHEAWAGG